MTSPRLLLFVSLLLQFIVIGVYSATTFTFSNNCGYTVWPGLLASAGSPPLETTGFVLQKGESRTISAPPSWSGRFWGRTLCTQDGGKLSCVTGDCGSGNIECAGAGAAPPATLAEFTLNGSGGFDFYDVSLVDGYNIQMLVVPQSEQVGVNVGGGNCNTTGCLVDLNGMCPSELKVMSSVDGSGTSTDVACKSACEAFRKDEYCCSGDFGNPNTCKPSSYSEIFKSACPRAYSYAYDDGTSTFTCPSGVNNYLIAYCPPSTANSQKSSHYPEAAMFFLGNQDASVASSSTRREHGGVVGGVLHLYLLVVAVSIFTAVWQL